MYAEDRVLVGVINRKKDLDQARYHHWYRIPRGRAAKGIHAEYDIWSSLSMPSDVSVAVVTSPKNAADYAVKIAAAGDEILRRKIKDHIKSVQSKIVAADEKNKGIRV